MSDDQAEAAQIAPADAEAFRNAMSRIAAAVHVVTTDGPAGRAGVTVTAMTPVSDAPATILFCLNRASTFTPKLKQNGVFCINTLAAGAPSVALAEAFAGRTGLDQDDRFAQASWMDLATGSPVLHSAHGALDCRVTEIRTVATHSVVFGEVLAIHSGATPEALVYLERTFRGL
ncbi:flavin reductase family protein [Breoghania sp. L-A4]|uniref:flavin reductase family protein n=1 Tax=Breoghania sp. L-A4 TaxID=2304600 RepID=UPI000E35C7B9|nr:flavin reductase family protein [Breoghania sp. L-A4]AXS41145.1 hypothetical protein D1F64_15350 [Breoghania sp. L-A4]